MGPHRISTGVLRHDKRDEPGNLVNCPNFKIKRQQKSCSGCLIGSAAADAARRSGEDREPGPASIQR